MFSTASVFFLSASVLAYETILIRVLPVFFWQPFVTLALGTALLGFGIGGSLLAWFGRWLLARRRGAFCLLAWLAAVSFRPALWSVKSLGLEPGLIFRDPGQWMVLAELTAALTVPFSVVALALAIPLLERENVGRYYGWNLLGSCVGAVLALAGSEVLPLRWLASLPTLAAGLAFVLALPRPRRRTLTFACAAAAAAVSFWPPQPVGYGPYKDISYALRLPGVRVEASEHGVAGTLEIVRAPSLRSAPGLSTRYAGMVPEQAALFRDGDRFGTALPSGDPRDPALDYLSYQVSAAPYAVLPQNAQVAVLGFDGGEEAHRALRHGASRVVYVEPDHAVGRLVASEPLLFGTGFSVSGRVTFDHGPPRAVLASLTGVFDAVVLPMGGSLASAVAGFGGVAEGYALTSEGLEAALAALRKGGVLAVNGWNQSPPTDRIKLLAALRRTRLGGKEGANRQVLVVTGWSTWVVLASEVGFTAEECARLGAFAAARGYTVQEGREAAVALLDSAREWGEPAGRLDLRPATDIRPYPWHALSAASLLRLAGARREDIFPRVEWGFLFLVMSLALSCAGSAGLLALSLPGKTRRAPLALALVCFAGLGIGYMAIEVALIKRAVLVIAPTVLAAAAVLASMLAASGAGSLAAARIGKNPTLRNGVFVLIPLLALLAFFILPLPLPMAASSRLAFTCAATALPAFFMGMPFPLILGGIGGDRDLVVPWSWAVSGYASAAGGALAGVLAVTAGLGWLLGVGGMCYFLVGALSAWRR